MKREKAYRAMRACEETWNEKTCKQIREALEQEPCVVNIKDLSDDEIKKLEEVMKKVTVQVISKEPCEDAISRQAAINVADYTDDIGLAVEDVKKVTDAVVKELKCLPSVTPKQRTARWIKEDVLTFKCSACGEKAIIAHWTAVLSDFCPNCGAKMEEQA